VFEGWPKWDRLMEAKAGRPVPERVPVFEEFSREERTHRETFWKAEQSVTSPAPTEPSFRGWLEGKPNPVLPEDAALYPKDSRASESGTKLVGLFPGAPVGTTYPVPDPELEPPPRRVSHTDRLATYPSMDEGNSEQLARLIVGSLFRRRMLRLTAVVG